MDEQYDVVIVGYGPVGQLLATLLGRAGHRVAVMERWPSFYPMPRAVHFDFEIARILQNIGLRPDQSSAIEPYDDLYAWRNAERKMLLEVDWSGLGPTGWHTANFFVQPLLEAQFDRIAREQPTVSVHRGWEAVAVEDEPGDALKVVVEQTNGGEHTGERRTVTCRYVVGADGANSMVRGAMGSPLHDLGFFFDWLIVDLVLHDDRRFEPAAWQLCDPARPTTLVPGGPGRRRWEFMRLPHETIADLNHTERAWELLAPWDVRPENATLERHTVYTFQARWAETWRKGRLLIAGDAAHLMPPFAGQGMCAGLRDAMNLAWKLDLVLRQKASDSLLDSYTPERLPHVREFINFSIELGEVICISDAAAAAERDRQMMAELADSPPAQPPPSPRLGRPGLLHPDSAAAGLVSIQASVTTIDATGLFDDVVSPGCLLLASKGIALDDGRRQALAEAGLPVVALGETPAPGVVVDDTGGYRTWLGELQADIVLIRPDFAVYGTASGDGGAASLVDAFLAALDPGASVSLEPRATAQATT